MLRFMLDTDICSCIMKRRDKSVLHQLETVAADDMCTSAIVKSELEFGVAVSPRRDRDRAALDDFLRDLLVLDYPGDASIDYAKIRAELESLGTPIGTNDLLIAGHARFLGLTLITNNTREFQRVPGLKIENWTERLV